VCGGSEALAAETPSSGEIFGDLFGTIPEPADNLAPEPTILLGFDGQPPPGFFCPQFNDFSRFVANPPPRTTLAAFTSTLLSLAGDTIFPKFTPGRSWVNRDVVPRGAQRAPIDARAVNSCEEFFNKPQPIPPFIFRAASCPASKIQERKAATSLECETVVGKGLDKDRQADVPRLLRHEQYHMNLTCSLARIGNRLIGKGSSPRPVAAKAIAANTKLQAQYDKETGNGCLPTAQARWEDNIDKDQFTL
jgi:hypothetical protein